MVAKGNERTRSIFPKNNPPWGDYLNPYVSLIENTLRQRFPLPLRRKKTVQGELLAPRQGVA
jgi:hypothetical protein